jgi:cellulose synthase/poly-beta-1,6-N-acetylglucosamine synthase-like glycosyltransferase
LFLQSVFLISLFAIFFVYIGYPVFIAVWSVFRTVPIDKRDVTPVVTIIIPAYNEESCIAGTLENKLDLSYPSENLEIIVVSDASSDQTDEIVKRYESDGVILLRQKHRGGKTSAINDAIKLARGELIVFSDANSIYSKDVLISLAANFADETVGYATGKMMYVNSDMTPVGDGCSAYMKYENRIRRLETRVGSVVGVDGGIDMMRKSLYSPMRPDQLPDFILPLMVVEKGYRVVFEPDAVLNESTLNSDSDEYRMRVRVSLRALWALFDMRHLLSVRNYGVFAFQLLAHKVLRYLIFIFLCMALVSNLLIAGLHPLYLLIFTLQLLAYAAGIVYPFLKNENRLIYLCRYFILLNLASAHAFWRVLRGKKIVVWNPRKG